MGGLGLWTWRRPLGQRVEVRTQDFEGAAGQAVQHAQVIADTGLDQESDLEGVDEEGFRGGVRGADHAFRMGVADGGFEVFEPMRHDLLNLVAQLEILGADLAAERAKRATQHAAVAFLQVHLLLDRMFAVTPDAFERGDGGGKDRIQGRTVLFPLHRERRLGQRGFVVEEVVEGAFLDPGSLADLVDGRAVVRVRPEQLRDGVHQSFSWIAGSAHGEFVRAER